MNTNVDDMEGGLLCLVQHLCMVSRAAGSGNDLVDGIIRSTCDKVLDVAARKHAAVLACKIAVEQKIEEGLFDA